MNYYNEFDPAAAEWLRELIKHDHIPPGDVDTRSIEDVRPSEIREYTQCHFFAGIGGWSLALQLAAWPANRPVWTGSCPCQPFSAAGKGAGFDDERHLWPAFYHLIGQCKPAIVFGEQVASKAGLAWLDLVSTDLESAGYATGAADLCAAGVGAPHIRQRLYWVAHTGGAGLERRDFGAVGRQRKAIKRGGGAGGVEHAQGDGRHQRRAESGGRGTATGCGTGGLADAEHTVRRTVSLNREDGHHGPHQGGEEAHGFTGTRGEICQPGPTNGFWRDADWLFCRDGKWRGVEPGAFPLVARLHPRVVRLRGYGNAIVPQVAQAFIEATGLI